MGVVFSISLEQSLKIAKEEHEENKMREIRQHGRRLVKIQKNTRMVVELARVLPVGCDMSVTSVWELEAPCVLVPRDLLPALRKALGRLTMKGKRLLNAKERQIRVSLESERFPGVTFHYDRELPPDTEGRCQIKKQVNEYSTLVCTI